MYKRVGETSGDESERGVIKIDHEGLMVIHVFKFYSKKEQGGVNEML